MATISENLQTIQSSMSAIKQAISDRGGDVSGDITTWANTIETMEGGGGLGGAYGEVNHGTSDTTFTLTPNKLHIWDEVSSLTLTLGDETAGVANEYLFQFTSGATATSLTLPNDIKWANDNAPSISENMIYQIRILNGLAVCLEFSNAPEVITFYVRLNGNYVPLTCSPNMTWSEFVNSEYNTELFRIDSSNRVVRGSTVVINQTASSIIENGVQYDTFMDV